LVLIVFGLCGSALAVLKVLTTLLCTNAGTATRCDNTFIGFSAGAGNTANKKPFIGGEAGHVNTTGTLNTFVGFHAGFSTS